MVLGGCVVIQVAADSFVWNMMRKLVSALMLVGGGQQTVEWFGKMLDPKVHTEGIRSAPAAGLILTRVEYKNVEFIEDSYCLLYTSDAADDLLCVDLGG